MSDLHPVEITFLQKQVEIHLIEAHVALVRAGACAASASETHYEIGQAIGYVGSALERMER